MLLSRNDLLFLDGSRKGKNMNNVDYIQQRRNRKKQWLRFRLGILQMIYKPLLNILFIPLVVMTVFMWTKKDIAFSLFNVPRFLFPIYEKSVNILVILLPFLFFLALIDMIGDITARKDEASLQEAFKKQELCNGCPILMDKKRVKESKIIMREFYSNIPMEIWIERRKELEHAMECRIVGEPYYGGKSNRKRIVICTTQGIEKIPRGDLYDEEL